MKKYPQHQCSPDQSDDLASNDVPQFLDVEKRVFTEFKGKYYIGREEINSTLRSILRDEAKAIHATQLWEILNASVINESYNLALIQATNMESLNYAKAMKHWSYFMMEVFKRLEKSD